MYRQRISRIPIELKREGNIAILTGSSIEYFDKVTSRYYFLKFKIIFAKYMY